VVVTDVFFIFLNCAPCPNVSFWEIV